MFVRNQTRWMNDPCTSTKDKFTEGYLRVWPWITGSGAVVGTAMGVMHHRNHDSRDRIRHGIGGGLYGIWGGAVVATLWPLLVPLASLSLVFDKTLPSSFEERP